MRNIDTTNWREYRMSDLFDIKGRGTINIEELNLKYGEGEYPYITRTEKNNGVTDFFDYKTVERNVMTIETTLSGICFYHEYEFSTGDHIAVLKPKKFELNKYIALFIKAIWRKNSYKYDYGRPAVVENIKNTYIILPSKNKEPDWKYMENYMQKLEKQIKFKPIETKKPQNKSVNMTYWKEFSFLSEELWESVEHGVRLKSSDRIPGEIPYYSASEFNNGITDSISNPLFTWSNSIIYTTFGDAFWVEENEFSASDEVYAFKNSKLNKYSALFICTLIRQNKYKYKFGRKAFLNKFENEIIKLPIDGIGKPDFKYMEDYIKSLPYAEYL